MINQINKRTDKQVSEFEVGDLQKNGENSITRSFTNCRWFKEVVKKKERNMPFAWEEKEMHHGD
jgi:hypothetical protein